MPVDLVPNAVALRSVASTTAVITGPAVGGLLFAWKPEAVYALAAFLFAVAAVCMIALRVPRRARDEDEAVGLDALVEGLRFVWRTKMLLGAITLDLFAVLFGGGIALLPIYARDILHVGPVGLGILRAAPAVGAFAAALDRRPPAAAPRRRADADRRRRPLRRAEHRLGRVEVDPAHARRARRRRLRRHDQREHPLDHGRDGHAEHAARPGRRRRDGLHLRVERARRVRVGRGRGARSARSPTVVAGGIATIGIALASIKLFPDLAQMGKLEDLRPEPAATLAT